MSKKSLSNVFKAVGGAITKHSPEILVGVGIAGMVTTTILAVRATPKALYLIEQEKERQNQEFIEEARKQNAAMCPQVDKLNKKDVIRVTWKCYIPATVTGVLSIACLVGASSVHLKRNAMLATAYKLSETAFTEYKEKVVETIGEKKEKAVRENIQKDRLEKNPVSKNEVILTEKGNTLCYDPTCDRYFKSDINEIKKAINNLNSKLLCEDTISLNQLYAELGLGYTSIGSELGWNTSMCRQIELQPHSLLTENDTPCYVLDFKVAPKYEFDKYY